MVQSTPSPNVLLMRAVTRDLLRKRAEHNEGNLSSLEEITLHQFDIERIELLEEYCRRLRIIFLQSNQIMKIENVGKLKSLEYLNLALNNITRIENLEGCESLRKLDLTVNFIDDVVGVESLRRNEMLRELYLTGNPCTSIEGYREFVIMTLPQLMVLDGREITKSERIQAAQVYQDVRDRLLASKKLQDEQDARENEVKNGSESDENKDQPNGEWGEQLTQHTPAARLQAARELAEKRAQGKPDMEERFKPAPRPPPAEPTFRPDGRILQRNEGKWEFAFSQTHDGKSILLNIKLSRFLDISLVDLSIHPTWICMVVKSKALHLAIPDTVVPETSEAVRSQTTGYLQLCMPRADMSKIQEIGLRKEDKVPSETLTGYVAGKSKRPVENEDKKKVTAPVDWKNIVSKPPAIQVTKRPEPKQPSADFIDDPEVPPLM